MDVLSDIVEHFDENEGPPPLPTLPSERPEVATKGATAATSGPVGFPIAQHRSAMNGISLGTHTDKHKPRASSPLRGRTSPGHRAGKGLLDLEAIDADAKERVLSMPEEQKQEWLSDINTLLSPEFVESLKRGGLKRFKKGSRGSEEVKQGAEEAEEEEEDAVDTHKGTGSFTADKATISKALAGVETDEDLQKLASEYLSDAERAKLDWTKPVSSTQPSAAAAIRFNLEGAPVSAKDKEDTTLYVCAFLALPPFQSSRVPLVFPLPLPLTFAAPRR